MTSEPPRDPVAQAVATLALLTPSARERVLERMSEEHAQAIRTRLETLPDDRPAAALEADLATQRRMLRELSERIHQRRTDVADRAARDLDAAAAGVPAPLPSPGAPPAVDPPAPESAPMAIVDPLAQLRVLHPAAVARAMQGERAEAWACVLERLDSVAREALDVYLDDAARAAIVAARSHQHELRDTAPALLTTIESAIARTVVPRAMREHHLLLSNAPTLNYIPTGAAS